MTYERYITPQHCLRKLYLDPITNQAKWGLVMAPEGGIVGVHSLSEATPIKSGNFGYGDESFEGKAKYSDWVFAYRPQTVPQNPVKQ
jgi:hypothetical protein